MKRTLSMLAVVMLSMAIFTETSGQNRLSDYLGSHHYAFSPDSGFGAATSDTIAQKLRTYRIVLQAEGGSHYLDFYDRLGFVWIRILSTHFGLTHFFEEGGHAWDLFVDKYMETGDTSYILSPDKTFWKIIRAYNLTVPDNRKLHSFGVDFENPRVYTRALKLILPGRQSISLPESIGAFVGLIQNSPDTFRYCSPAYLALDAALKKSLLANRPAFVQYFGEHYADLERIVLNKGLCTDRYKNRNGDLAETILSVEKQWGDSVYYGEFGEAHTVLNQRNLASLLNKTGRFKGKVGVINVYCYHCHTAEETVSNWPLKKIEGDIVQYFLPYCHTDFTLFDLSDKSGVIEKYRAFGQFLVIARDQH